MVSQQVEHVAISKVKPAPDNQRKKLGDLAELAMSIKSVGIIEPIVARKIGDSFEVIAGARRLAAAELAGEKTVPLIVRELSEEERVLAMAIENLQREDLSAIEEAGAYQRLLDTLGCSQRDLAPKVGKTQSHISKRLTLLQLPAKVQAEVDSGGITIEDALQLAKLVEHPERLQAVLDRPQYSTLEAAIAHQARELERDTKIAAIEAAIETKGLASVRVQSEHQLPKGVHRLSGSNIYDAHALQISAKKHETHTDCHAIAIATTHPHLVQFPVCTNRKNHPAVKTKQEADRAKNGSSSGGSVSGFKAPKEDPTTKKLREARTQRIAFAEGLVAKKAPKDAAALVMLTYVEDAIDYGDIELADVAIALGLIDRPESDDDQALEKAIGGRDLHDELRGLARAGDAQLQRVALAMLIAQLDGNHYSGVDSYIRTGGRHSVRTGAEYLAFLQAQGYKLSDLEQKRLGAESPSAKAA